MLVLICLSLLAGVITTVAGMGGGLVLLLGLSFFIDPLVALMTTGPALLIGNLHRVMLYREHVRRPLAWRLVLGAAPGALLGGLVAVALPDVMLRSAMVVLAVLATAKVVLGVRFTPPANALVPGGAAIGFVTATSGGGGLISGPLLLASGLSGRPYVATGAVAAATVHVFRLTGYGAAGSLNGTILLMGLVGAICIATGNLMGERLRGVIPEEVVPRLEVAVVLTCLGLALAGLG
ncbi:MAG: sulfite exporter TauE/SafE family protein [Deltaproteobacteria bacterium]|nr:sulfite exporter TauE/SafE family protein [Deltaproteobacteria bacterium]